jgi:outer membrane lipopolysaccharide assembly protein LptE/RlpB
MADHLRKQIRTAVKTALTGLSTTATRVYASRVADLTDGVLPALRIYTTEQSTELLSMGSGRIREHRLTLVVEACVRSNTTPDDTADQICKEVEVALDTPANQSLGGLCKWIELKQFEQEMDGEGSKSVFIHRMNFEVYYVTAQGAPDVPL